jgi:type VI secretion system protein ImpJ
MSINNKVMWTQGLFLEPQHFQQQERYLERYIDGRCRPIQPYGWGFRELEIEASLLAIGKLGVRRAVGVFPDGTPFRMPDDDPLPAPVDIDESLRGCTVHLCLRLAHGGALEAAREAASDTLARHQIGHFKVPDVTTDDAQDVLLEVGHLKTRLLTHELPGSEHSIIPIAHVQQRRADGQVVLEPAFIPTVLDARAAPVLRGFIDMLVGLLHQRGEALAGRAVASGQGAAAEIVEFLLLQIINRYEPLVLHFSEAGLHPQQLYQLCVALAGELSTFTQQARRPVSLAGYRHERLRESFEPVFAALRTALATVLDPTAIPIDVAVKKHGYRLAVVNERALFTSAVFVLAVRAEVATEELRRRLPAQLKVGPGERIRELVTLQLPGIPISAMAVAPRQIPYHPGCVYFELDQSNALWTELKSSAAIALHVGGEFAGLQMDLWAIRA